MVGAHPPPALVVGGRQPVGGDAPHHPGPGQADTTRDLGRGEPLVDAVRAGVGPRLPPLLLAGTARGRSGCRKGTALHDGTDLADIERRVTPGGPARVQLTTLDELRHGGERNTEDPGSLYLRHPSRCRRPAHVENPSPTRGG
jgi:hypothetical protein